MNIVGFGDSFIMPGSVHDPRYPKQYMNQVGTYFNSTAESRGVEGTGPWNMFFDFMNYKKHIDVAILAWSEPIRLYHPKVKPLNTHIALDTPLKDDENKPIYEAANLYYKYLFDHTQKNWELKGLMCLFDHVISKQYPKTKFIHLPCFSCYDESQYWFNLYDKVKPRDIEYYHDFTTGVEIRPCLMFLSKKDDFPKDITKEHRANHLSLNMHTRVARSIIDAIENYVDGRKINIL